ncbi:MAG: hypothetical protein LUD77_00375 [Clostridiales bacterium]|nr:hypothetical protein [Clostridiales bacterium]
MKKEYTSPKLKIFKISSEENITDFVSGNYNVLNVKLPNINEASNVISY